jgi:hypothetical protein
LLRRLRILRNIILSVEKYSHVSVYTVYHCLVVILFFWCSGEPLMGTLLFVQARYTVVSLNNTTALDSYTSSLNPESAFIQESSWA